MNFDKIRAINLIHYKQLNLLYEKLTKSKFKIIEINGKTIVDEKSFYEVALKQLPQDPLLVNQTPNWDAFSDSIATGLSSMGVDKVGIVWTNGENILKKGLQDLLHISFIFNDMAKYLYNLEIFEDDDINQVNLFLFISGKGNNFKNLNEL